MQVIEKQSFSPGNLIQAKVHVNGARAVYIILDERYDFGYCDTEYYLHGTNRLGREETIWLFAEVLHELFEVISHGQQVSTAV